MTYLLCVGCLAAGGEETHSAGNSPPPAVSVAVFTIYLALPPVGSDRNDGRTAATPVLTLSRAHDIIQAAAPAMNTEVLIASGTYFFQHTVWSYTNAKFSITFKPADPSASVGAVIFDGCTKATTNYAADCPDPLSLDPTRWDSDSHWFILNSRKGQPTNLHFERLEIQHYRNGLRFLGGKTNRDQTFNGANVVQDCYFHEIGNGWAPGLYQPDPTKPILIGYGAIRSINSDGNTFRRNRFRNILNVPIDRLGNGKGAAAIMHAMYLADGSDRNLISDNTLQFVSGDAVRFRNDSNYNQIIGNTFVFAGRYAAISTWAGTGECPCWGLVASDNRVDGSLRYDNSGNQDLTQSLPIWMFWDDAQSCPLPPAAPQRVTLTNNCVRMMAPYGSGDFSFCS